VIGGGIYALPKIPAFFNINNTYNNTKMDLQRSSSELAAAEAQAAQKITEVSIEGKKIYEAPSMSISRDASFAPLLETVINSAKTSGIRFRSIKYNYDPQEDSVYKANLPGYNVCELDLAAAGSYTKLQNFLKGIAKQEYLNNIAEIEITPYEQDRSVLLADIKLRLYTKTADTQPRAPRQAEFEGDPNNPDAQAADNAGGEYSEDAM
ncbi:hypothetical protein tpqmel_0813, partial [Candidatus Gastranaerophilus sp. (ex Termes propinquus)]